MIHKKCFWRFEIGQKQNKTKTKTKTTSTSHFFFFIVLSQHIRLWCFWYFLACHFTKPKTKKHIIILKKSSLKQIQLKHVKNKQNVHDDSRVLRDSDETSADDSTAGKSDGLHERRQTSFASRQTVQVVGHQSSRKTKIR